MTEIKICGITEKEDALFAAACGVDALGFIFHPLSPRYISPEKAQEIIANLPHEVMKVGVFVNYKIKEVKRIFSFCGLDLIQLHGDETPRYCRLLQPSRLIKVVSPQDDDDLEALKNYQVRAVLVDARYAGLYGGTGKKANWDLAEKVKLIHPLILSGGLKEENIGEALSRVQPHAVDINSGVEYAPGRKDQTLVMNIVRIIRSLSNPEGEKKIFKHQFSCTCKKSPKPSYRRRPVSRTT